MKKTNNTIHFNIKLLLLLTALSATISGCSSSDIENELANLKQQNIETAKQLESEREKNRLMEADLKISSHDLRFEQKQNNKEKTNLKKEYEIEFRDEITNTVKKEHHWYSFKIIGIFLIIILPAAYISYYKTKKEKDDLEKKYNHFIEDYNEKLDNIASSLNKNTATRVDARKEKTNLSGHIKEIYQILEVAEKRHITSSLAHENS